MIRVHRLAGLSVLSLFALAGPLTCGVSLAQRQTKATSKNDAATTDKPAPKESAKAIKATKATASMKALIAGLEKTEKVIQNLSVTTKYIKRQLFLLPVEEPIQMEMELKAIVTQDGRGWNDCVGEQVNIEPNGKDVRIYKGRWQGAFDGKVARRMQAYGENGDFSFGSISTTLTWHGINPLEFTTHYFRKPVSHLLKDKNATVVKQVVWDGRRVTIVDTTPTKAKRKYRFWIDPERQIVVRRAALIQFAADQEFQEYTRIESRKHQEIKPGIWLPTVVKYESVEVTKERTPEKLSWSYAGTCRDWKVNQTLADGTFVLEFPEGVRVTDRRPKRRPKPPAKKKKTTSSTAKTNKQIQEFLDRVAYGPKSNARRKRNRHTRNAAGQIVKLDLRNFKNLRVEDFSVIGRMKHLESLNLYSSNVTDGDLKHLSGLSDLRELDLSWTKISGAGLAHLKDLKKLRQLGLRLTKIKDQDMRVIAGLKSLRRLKISDTAITNNGLKVLFNRVAVDSSETRSRPIAGLTNLELLRVGDTKITDDGLRHLAGLKRLRGLTLHETVITPAGLQKLAENPHFRWIASDQKTVAEYIRRAESGEFEAIDFMSAPGVSLPDRGEYKLLKLDKLPQTERDKRIGRQAYYMEMHWIVAEEKIDDIVHIKFSVDRGTIRGHNVGLKEVPYTAR